MVPEYRTDHQYSSLRVLVEGMLVEVAGIVELGMSGALGRGSVLLLKSARDERERLSWWKVVVK